jgi:hypothetical protein
MQLRNASRVTLAAAFGLVVGATSVRAQVSIHGVGYTQFSYGLKTDSSLATPGHDNDFDVTRAYVNVLGKFDHGVQTRITTDVERGSTPSQLNIRLKYAFVGWTPENSSLTYKMGLFTTPWIDYEESLWGYRMQGTTIFDRNHFFPSSDFGIGADGSWSGDAVNMQVGVFNGEGYSGAPGDPGKDVEGRVSFRLARTDLSSKVGGVRLTAFGQVGSANGGGSRSRFVGMLSYKSKAVTLAGEFGVRQDSTGPTTPSQKGSAFGAYGVFNLPNSRAAIIARYDRFDPNTDVSDDQITDIIAGVSYTISPNVRVLLDADIASMTNSTNAFDAKNKLLLFQTEFSF